MVTAGATASQARATDDSAKAAIDAARAADASVRIAETLSRIEFDRRHDELTPQLKVRYNWERSRSTMNLNLFGYVTNPSGRDYEVDAKVIHHTGSTSDIRRFTLRAQQQEKLHVGDATSRRSEALLLRIDSVDPCPCSQESPPGQHWQRSFPIPQEAAPED